jgi:radical SAM superfamily enzyme YgiQ (UPF0313 family)
MKEAGCRTVYIGFESINPESLKEMRKDQTVEDIKRSIKVFRKNGIRVHGMFMLGSDSDTSEIFQATSKFCREGGLTSVQYLILTPLPGTEFYRRIEGEGRLLHKDWEFYDAMHVVFKPKLLTPKQLQEGMIDCFSDFYSYTNGINDALNAVGETLLTFIRKIYKKAYFPPLTPVLLKFFGKKIVQSWILYNRNYLHYLKRIS